MNIIMKNSFQIVIDNYQTISGLQKEFNSYFPFLKIEFFREPCNKGLGHSKDKMIRTDESLQKLKNKKESRKVNFSGNTTVQELEEKFTAALGLCTQVFRKSGRVWLETSATDNWTLEQQNDEGKSLAEHLKITRENPDDHDMY